jgi:hypothetical protein
MDKRDLYSTYLAAYGLKKAGDSEAASSLVVHAQTKSAQHQFAVALGLRDACEEEYTVDDETMSDSIFQFEGFSAAMELAFDGFDLS